MKDNNRVMPLLLRAEKIGEMIKKMDSENILTPQDNQVCHEVKTEEVFGYSEAERCSRIDSVGEIYKAKVDLLNGAAQKMVAAMKNEADPTKK